MTEHRVAVTALTAEQVTDIQTLAETATASDGVAPLSEHALLHVRYDSIGPQTQADPGRDFVLTVDGELAGYAYLDPPGPEMSGELVIHPARRRQGLGRVLVRELTAQTGGYPLRIWAHGDLPGAARLAQTEGFDRFRALWQMRRSLRDPLPAPAFPAGRTLRTFVRGQDEQEWLSLNGRVFAKHPEQGAWTRHDLELREQEPWFDPAGLFIADRDGTMAGFHWTKVHPEGEPDSGAAGTAPQSIGEVYVVGVDPAEQGSGLGRALTLAGLHHLRDLGLDQVMLYVDEDNVAAIRLYEGLGFARTRTDAMYGQRGR